MDTSAALDVACVAAGIVMLWVRWGKNGLQALGVHELLEQLKVTGGRAYLIELGAAVVLGTVVVVAFIRPHGPLNCLTAGCTWTGLLSAPAKAQPTGD